MFESMVSDGIAYTKEQYDLFLKAKGKPQVLDDSIIDRGIRVFQDQLEEADCHDRQISRWKSLEITESQRALVAHFEAGANQYRDITKQVLDLLEELRKGTINRILETDDEELGLDFLLGKIKPPSRGK